MSFIFIDNNNFEYSGLKLLPNVRIISSSVGAGATGSVKVHPNSLSSLKEMYPSNPDVDGDGITTIFESAFSEAFSPGKIIQNIQGLYKGYGDTVSYNNAYQLYLDRVNSANTLKKYQKTIDVFRFDQSTVFDKNRNIKNNIRKVLMPHHKHRYQNCEFSYTNYNTLNFFKSETVTTGSALIYPNSASMYNIIDKFSLNFWINPRYSDPGVYEAGTIFHLSSSVAVSILSGSGKDESDAAANFKILLQLKHSADSPPSSVDINLNNVYPNDLIFTSSLLTKNHWHNVHVHWGQRYNNYTGSIFVDDNETLFTVNSSSVGSPDSPAGIVIGNYFDGPKATFGRMLNNTKATEQGFYAMSAGPEPTITSNMFNHHLNAEIHDIKFYNKVLLENERQIAKSSGVENFDNLLFYLPPFFYPTSPTYEVIQTPFQKTTSTTDDPFNVAFSFGVNGKLINLQNFTRDFANAAYPRNFGMEPEVMTSTVQGITADDYVYSSGSIIKRNMLIMPNDNGLFTPNYSIFANEDLPNLEKFRVDKESMIDYSLIKLEDLIPSSSVLRGLTLNTGSLFNQLVGPTPENPGVSPGSYLTVAQRTRDASSNEITIVDISNLYYGNRIDPKSFSITDHGLTGSGEKVKVTLKDNGLGSLYRADANTKHATWNSVGSLLYDEGLVIVKSPHLFYYCKDKTDITLRGDQNIHTMILNVPVYADMFNSSSNPTYEDLTPSNAASDKELNTIYVTTVNIHDENFNIIMKANLAQPIAKTDEDEFIIRLKEDF